MDLYSCTFACACSVGRLPPAAEANLSPAVVAPRYVYLHIYTNRSMFVYRGLLTFRHLGGQSLSLPLSLSFAPPPLSLYRYT